MILHLGLPFRRLRQLTSVSLLWYAFRRCKSSIKIQVRVACEQGYWRMLRFGRDNCLITLVLPCPVVIFLEQSLGILASHHAKNRWGTHRDLSTRSTPYSGPHISRMRGWCGAEGWEAGVDYGRGVWVDLPSNQNIIAPKAMPGTSVRCLDVCR